ncbi:hypothetical protein [Nocardioides alcanivorans]|nr:hypothetical protein [Nocardioides alcanivorans]
MSTTKTLGASPGACSRSRCEKGSDWSRMSYAASTVRRGVKLGRW